MSVLITDLNFSIVNPLSDDCLTENNFTMVMKFVIDGIRVDEFYVNPPIPVVYQGVLSGKATIKGEPIADATINAFISETNEFVGTTTSDIEGNYTITGLDETKDHYIVVIEPSGEWEYRVRSRLRPVIVTP